MDKYVATIEQNDDGEKKNIKKSTTSKKLEEAKGVKCAIADIVFSFENRELILALRERGSQIAYQDFEQVEVCDKKINELFADFDKLTVPTSAFVTFETDDWKELSLRYKG